MKPPTASLEPCDWTEIVFVTDGDEFMDDVHDLRNTYAADIAILITSSPWNKVAGGLTAVEGARI